MIKVECVSCKSPYDVDERRIPDKGMKMRCPKCSTSFMVGRDGTTSAAQAARPPLAPPVVPAGLDKLGKGSLPPIAAEVRGPGAAPTEPAAAAVPAASLLNHADAATPPTHPKLAQAPSAFSKTLLGGAANPRGDAARPAALGNMLGLGAKPANDPAKPAEGSESHEDLPAVKPAAKPLAPWGSLLPPGRDARDVNDVKPQPARPGGAVGLPKGAIAGAGAPAAPGPSLKAASAGSAFGAPIKQTLLGPARAKAPGSGASAAAQPMAAQDPELADLPALRGSTPQEPLVDLPASKPRPDSAKGGFKPHAPAPELPVVDVPAVKARGATLLGQPDVHSPANSVEPDSADAADALVDLPAPRPPQPGAAFAAKHPGRPVARAHPEQPSAEPIVDLPAPTNVDLPARKPASAALGAFGAAGQKARTPGAGPDDSADLPAPRPGQAAPFRGGRGSPAAGSKADALSRNRPSIGTAETLHEFSDLPAPKAPEGVSRGSGDIDLPAPKGHAGRPAAPDVDLPAPKGPSREAWGQAALEPEIDLPAPKAKGSGGEAWGQAVEAPEIDLPAPKAPRREAWGQGGAVPEIDLPAPKVGSGDPAWGQGAAAPEIDLPAAKRAAPHAAKARGAAAAGSAESSTPQGFEDLPAVLGGVDLPTPKGSVDLPTPKGSVDLPALSGGVDLPTPKGLVDLPTPLGAADLPTPKGVTDLPVGKSEGGFGTLDLPIPRSPDEASFGDLELPDLPVRAGFGAEELPMPHARADRPSSSRPLPGVAGDFGMDESNFGDLDLGGPEMAEESFADIRPDDFVQLKDGQPASVPPALREQGGFGDETYGEAGLLDDGAEEDMEFGIADGDENLGLPPELLRRNKGEATQQEDTARGKRALRVLIGVAASLVLVGGAGAALGLTDYGFFGIYYWEQFLPEAADARFAHEAIARAEKMASTDTYRDVQRSLALLGESRHKAGLNRELLTRSLLHESLFAIRFGAHPASAGHAAAILARLEERHGRAPGMTLGRAADAARRGEYGEAQRLLDSARAQAGEDAYFWLLQGEVALHQEKLAEADKAFARALKLGASARAQWGLARVALMRTDLEMQRSAVEATLRLSPAHAEARLALARLLWNSGKQAQALTELNRALGKEPVGEHYLWSSKSAKAGGYSLLGYIQESRGHLSQARKAYDEALAADPYRLEALLGAGRVLLRERRWNDALARFESALNLAQKSSAGLVLSGRRADVEARLGQSHAQLALSRAEEAKATLAELMKDNPNDAEIVRAAGQAEDALGNGEAAEALLIKSVELAPTSFASYLALAQHYFKHGHADKASETLNEASTKVEENVEMRRMLGQSELARGRFDSAVHEFERAIELDPDDLDARFGLAQADRKLGRLDDARKLLDGIGQRDPQFAGLALERGLLLEAQGLYDEAVAAYRAAHAKDPSDSALNLRLGAAQVEAGHLEDAELTLQTVMRETPNSAEAEYFAGRLALARGRGPDALTHFDRALALDGTQAVYHLYAARAALDMSNLGRTLDEAEATIARDPSLGDAFWVRGIVRLRSGAVRDALKDAKRALDLNPNRNDAYALMAECYDELRQLVEAARTYRIALAKDPERGEWWYKLGRLSMDRGVKADASEALERARSIGDHTDPQPYWLPDAYRLLGELARGAHDRKRAVELFRRYLAIAPDGALDREDVRRLLMSWEVEIER